jgi:hypothetical protein
VYYGLRISGTHESVVRRAAERNDICYVGKDDLPDMYVLDIDECKKNGKLIKDISEGTNLSQIENWDKVNSPIDFSFIRNYVPKNPLLRKKSKSL